MTCEASFEMIDNKANSNEKLPPRRLPFNRKFSKNGESFTQNYSNDNLLLSQDEDTHIEDSFMVIENIKSHIYFENLDVININIIFKCNTIKQGKLEWNCYLLLYIDLIIFL